MRMTTVSSKVVYLCYLTVMSLFIFSCQSENELEKKVLEGALKESLLTYDLYDSTLNKGIVAIGDTSILLSEGDKETINRHFEEITNGNTTKKILISKLISESRKEAIVDLELPNFKLQRQISPADKVIGSVYVSSIVVTDSSSLALFFYRFRCGNDCGSGNIVFVKRNKDKWEIEQVYPLYMI